GPSVKGGAQKGERGGDHLRVLEGEVGSQQADMVREPVLVFRGSFDDVHSRHTPGVSIHFSTPAALGAKRSQSMRTRAAFLISTCKAGLSRRKARSSLRLRISSHASKGEDSGTSALVRTIWPL